MDQTKAPLFAAIAGHLKGNPTSFHVPGHKSVPPAENADSAVFFRGALALDLTELPGLDDLHHPQGAILEAEKLAAACFGADETHFLVGGSTSGNLALILAVCAANDLIITQRNVHKSVLNGLMLAEASVVFLPPKIDPRTGVACGVEPEAVRAALTRFPEAKAVLLTNPNYYGMAMDLRAITEMVHSFGKPVLVDEAHGAHFAFHPGLPPSALSCGADAAVQSTHKLLSAMTMGAMLHLQGDLLDRESIRWHLAALQSSSPSYPIMASLDLARREAALYGRDKIAQGLAAVETFHRLLAEMPWFYAEAQASRQPAFFARDPFKVILHDRTGTISGPQLLAELARDGCFAEMADPLNTVVVFSLHSTAADAVKLARSLRRISADWRLAKKELPVFAANNNIYTPFANIQSLSTVSFREWRRLQRKADATVAVKLHSAIGCRSAEAVIPYPPGIPLVYPGEIITPEAVAAIDQLSACETRFQGCSDPTANTVNIFKMTMQK
ncbi:MAG TPA: aminotransferase class I/II-fold pyridoxal phosphate-dependent enzyme [Bacilli bacterium]